MYNNILVPIDLSDAGLAKSAISTAVMLLTQSNGTIRLINVLALTPVMLAEYVPPDFEVQQRKAAEDALAIMGSEIGLEPARVSAIVRQGGVYQEILEEAAASGADLIVMTSHRPQRHAVRTYFLGSNTGHVVRYARCSVLVVRKLVLTIPRWRSPDEPPGRREASPRRVIRARDIVGQRGTKCRLNKGFMPVHYVRYSGLSGTC
jgi:nucleotide-binding universal stress UspA family protein